MNPSSAPQHRQRVKEQMGKEQFGNKGNAYNNKREGVMGGSVGNGCSYGNSGGSNNNSSNNNNNNTYSNTSYNNSSKTPSNNKPPTITPTSTINPNPSSQHSHHPQPQTPKISLRNNMSKKLYQNNNVITGNNIPIQNNNNDMSSNQISGLMNDSREENERSVKGSNDNNISRTDNTNSSNKGKNNGKNDKDDISNTSNSRNTYVNQHHQILADTEMSDHQSEGDVNVNRSWGTGLQYGGNNNARSNNIDSNNNKSKSNSNNPKNTNTANTHNNSNNTTSTNSHKNNPTTNPPTSLTLHTPSIGSLAMSNSYNPSSNFTKVKVESRNQSGMVVRSGKSSGSVSFYCEGDGGNDGRGVGMGRSNVGGGEGDGYNGNSNGGNGSSSNITGYTNYTHIKPNSNPNNQYNLNHPINHSITPSTQWQPHPHHPLPSTTSNSRSSLTVRNLEYGRKQQLQEQRTKSHTKNYSTAEIVRFGGGGGGNSTHINSGNSNSNSAVNRIQYGSNNGSQHLHQFQHQHIQQQPQFINSSDAHYHRQEQKQKQHPLATPYIYSLAHNLNKSTEKIYILDSINEKDELVNNKMFVRANNNNQGSHQGNYRLYQNNGNGYNNNINNNNNNNNDKGEGVGLSVKQTNKNPSTINTIKYVPLLTKSHTHYHPQQQKLTITSSPDNPTPAFNLRYIRSPTNVEESKFYELLQKQQQRQTRHDPQEHGNDKWEGSVKGSVKGDSHSVNSSFNNAQEENCIRAGNSTSSVNNTNNSHHNNNTNKNHRANYTNPNIRSQTTTTSMYNYQTSTTTTNSRQRYHPSQHYQHLQHPQYPQHPYPQLQPHTSIKTFHPTMKTSQQHDQSFSSGNNDNREGFRRTVGVGERVAGWGGGRSRGKEQNEGENRGIVTTDGNNDDNDNNDYNQYHTRVTSPQQRIKWAPTSNTSNTIPPTNPPINPPSLHLPTPTPSSHKQTVFSPTNNKALQPPQKSRFTPQPPSSLSQAQLQQQNTRQNMRQKKSIKKMLVSQSKGLRGVQKDEVFYNYTYKDLLKGNGLPVSNPKADHLPDSKNLLQALTKNQLTRIFCSTFKIGENENGCDCVPKCCWVERWLESGKKGERRGRSLMGRVDRRRLGEEGGWGVEEGVFKNRGRGGVNNQGEAVVSFGDVSSDPTKGNNLLPSSQQSQTIKQIAKDIPRTCSSHPTFKNPAYRQSLRSLLTNFYHLDPTLGYVQGMNIIGACIVYHSKSLFQSLHLMDLIMNTHNYRTLYMGDMSKCKQLTSRTVKLVRHFCYDLYSHVCIDMQVDIGMFVIGWYFSMLGTFVPLQAMHLVVDRFVEKQFEGLVKVIVTYFIYIKDLLMDKNDPNQIMEELSLQCMVERSKRIDWVELVAVSERLPIVLAKGEF